MLQWWHWVLIIAAFILLFGARKLPDAARGVGRSLRILKSEVSAMHDDDAKPTTPAESDASAAVATPTAQIAAAPVAPQPAASQTAAPQTAAPQPAVPQTVPQAAAPQQAPVAPPQPQQAPVINGVPVSSEQQAT